uniref:Uncharacterized protein n=1 Tax=Opuntia streptacantha TaxID=393608 RepID=A0A7C8Z1X2_OPUST
MPNTFSNSTNFKLSYALHRPNSNVRKREREYGVPPAILSVDVGAKLDQALGNIKPTMEGGNVERSAVVVIPSVDERWIFFQKLPHSRGVVLVCVPQDRRRLAHPSLLLLLLSLYRLRRGGSSLRP